MMSSNIRQGDEGADSVTTPVSGYTTEELSSAPSSLTVSAKVTPFQNTFAAATFTTAEEKNE